MPLTAPRQVVPEWVMLRPVDAGLAVPFNDTAQLLLPGTDATAVLDQVMPFAVSVACAEPLPDICTVPLQVAENEPDTDVAVRLAIVHLKSPHVPCCAVAALVDAQVPALNPVEDSVVVPPASGDVAPVTIPPHAVVANRTATAADRSLKRMAGTVARL